MRAPVLVRSIACAAALLLVLTACSGGTRAQSQQRVLGAGPMGPDSSMSIAQAPRVITTDPMEAPPPAMTDPFEPVVQGTPVSAPAAAAPTAAVDNAFGFRFQVGDEVEISIWGESDLTTQHKILRDGTVPAKVIGNVRIAGRTIDDVTAELTRRYTEFLVDPRPSIKVMSVLSDRIFVLGEVRDPAAIPLGGQMTLMQAIAAAGGFEEGQASKSMIRIVRPGEDLTQTPELISVNASALICGRGGRNTLLQPGDVVYVHPNSNWRWSRDLNISLQPIVTALNGVGSIATAVLAFDR